MKEDFPRPALTADAVLLRQRGSGWDVLLVRRGREPFEGMWALPGGFVDPYEAPEDAARRELAEETGVHFDGDLSIIGVWGGPGRDPRGWTVSVVFAGVCGPDDTDDVAAGDDAAEAAWHPLDDLPDLAFDHAEILDAARRRFVSGKH